MKTKSFFLAFLCCMFMFACSNEKDAPAITRLDNKEEVKATENAGICFSCLNREQATEAYSFPATSGSGSDLLELNQIPDAILKNMTTKGLVQSLLTFPTILNWTLNNYSAYRGFLLETESITIFPELFKRSDAATCLLDLYKVYDQYACDGGVLTMHTFDMILSLPEIYTKFSEQEKKDLFETAINKIENLRKDEKDGEDVLWWFDADKYLYLGRIMYSSSYSPLVESVDADEYLSSFLEKPEDFHFNNSGPCTPERFHEFFMSHAKAFLLTIPSV